jgi:hypothetical protein
MFLKNSFEFYSENESKIEFFTWYRQHDKQDGTCANEKPKIGDESIDVGKGSSLGSSEHVIERLGHYICSSGLVDINRIPKPSWTEFKNQINMLG